MRTLLFIERHGVSPNGHLMAHNAVHSRLQMLACCIMRGLWWLGRGAASKKRIHYNIKCRSTSCGHPDSSDTPAREGFMDVPCHFYIFIACFDKLMQILFGPRGDTLGGGAAVAPVTASGQIRSDVMVGWTDRYGAFN